MKSPLVEALRQASGKNAETEPAQPAAAEELAAPSDAATADDPAPDPGDLELMAATGVMAVDRDDILPIDGPGILPIDGPGILPIDGDGIPPLDSDAQAPDEEADARFHETTALDVVDEAATAVDEVAAEPLPPLPAASRSTARSGISRLGLYSPLICVVLGATATGCYFLYQGLAAWHHNRDLELLSTQIDTSVAPAQADEYGMQGAQNPFQLRTGLQGAVRDGTPTTAMAGDAVAVGTTANGAAIVAHSGESSPAETTGKLPR